MVKTRNMRIEGKASWGEHQKKRFELAKNLCEQVLHEEDVISVYVWGSTAEGKAIKLSDLDIAVITREKEDAKVFEVDGITVTIDFLPMSLIKREIRNGNLWVIESLRSCKALYDKNNVVPKLKRSADAYYPSADIWNKVDQALLEMKDGLDLYNNNDLSSTILASRKASELLVIAYLYSEGFLRMKSKWTLEYLRRSENINGSKIIDIYQQTMGLVDKKIGAREILFGAFELYYIITDKIQSDSKSHR